MDHLETYTNNITLQSLHQWFDRKSTTKKTSKNLRILALNWRCIVHPQAGGSEENLFQQAKNWQELGHHVTIFTAHPGKDLVNKPHKLLKNINLLRYGNRITVYLFALVYVLIFGHQYDLILDVANGVPFFTPLVTRKPVTLLVHHVHDKQWEEEFPTMIAKVGWFLESKVTPWLYRNKKVITVSPTTYAEMIEIGYREEDISIVFNGLDITTPPFIGDRSKPRIAYVGRVKAYKRLEILIRAVWVLSLEFPDIHLDIAGSGDYSDELRQWIKDLGLEASVTLHGFVSEEKKIEILSNARVFATPSLQEGWGISVLEANAYGCPAVAYDVPGLSAAIPPNETGLLAKDDDEFIDHISKILSDDELLERLSNGAVFWASMFDWQETANATLDIMDQSS